MAMIPPEQIKQILDKLTEPSPISLKPQHREQALADRAREQRQWDLEAEMKTSSVLPKRLEEIKAEELERRIEEVGHREEQARRQASLIRQEQFLAQEERKRRNLERLIQIRKAELSQVKRMATIPEAGELTILRESQKKEREAQFSLKALLDKEKRIHQNKSWF